MGQFLSTRQKEFPFGPYANKSRSFSLIFFGPCVKCPKAHPFGPYAKLYLFLFSGKTSTSWSKAQPFDSTIDVRRENVMTFDDSGWEIFQKGIFIQFVCYGPKKLKWPNNNIDPWLEEFWGQKNEKEWTTKRSAGNFQASWNMLLVKDQLFYLLDIKIVD